MKTIFLLALSAVVLQAQIPVIPVTPATPKGFEKRGAGGSSGVAPTADVTKDQPRKILRYVTHVALSEERSWTSDDGKVIQATLLAFEDLKAESNDGVVPTMPAPPQHPTVVRGGNIRLSVNRKPVVLALSRLSKADQEFVEKVRQQHTPQP
jgi:hypothetical protein